MLETPENFDFRGIKARDVKSLRIKELLNADIFSETMIHNILGGIGIYKVSGGHVELLQVNEHYYKVTGSSPIDLEAQRLQFQSGIYEADRKELLDIFQRADKNRLNGGSGQIRHILADGSVIWIQLHAFFSEGTGGRQNLLWSRFRRYGTETAGADHNGKYENTGDIPQSGAV